jgi:gentisate 1,2-dioxygenase
MDPIRLCQSEESQIIRETANTRHDALSHTTDATKADCVIAGLKRRSGSMNPARPLSPATLTDDEQIEYSSAADPTSSGATPRIPIRVFSPYLYQSGATRIVPLDLSSELKTSYAATGPSLLASFIRIQGGQEVATLAKASSELFYVIRGSGHSATPAGLIDWREGDVIALPGSAATHFADTDSEFYSVNDSPLLNYLGVQSSEERFQPTLFTSAAIRKELENAKKDPMSTSRRRVSVLLANRRFEQTRTLTHTLWCMFGSIAPDARQLAHRHQSVALDFVVDAKPGVYTLLGSELNEDGTIQDPLRIDWVKGAAFVMPPGYWHEHVNESGAEAIVMPIQDAGLHSYLRTLDIRF